MCVVSAVSCAKNVVFEFFFETGKGKVEITAAAQIIHCKCDAPSLLLSIVKMKNTVVDVGVTRHIFCQHLES